jgi:GH43 family beta-xylosidase
MALIIVSIGCKKEESTTGDNKNKASHKFWLDTSYVIGGINRATVVFVNKDANAAKAVVKWNTLTDSVVWNITTGSDTVRIPLENLPDGNYTFVINTYNKDNVLLKKGFANTVVYTDVYAKFVNPLFNGADPWVAQKNGMYYCTYTTGSNVEIRATKKMSEVASAIPVTIWTPPTGALYRNIWAPELHEINGAWYCYIAADDGNDINHRMYVLENTSADPLAGNWNFRGKITDSTDQWAIDATILQYNNNLYMLWSGRRTWGTPQRIYIAKLSNPWTVAGNRVELSYPQYSWEKSGWDVNEGPQVIKSANGRVFLVYSASGFTTDQYCLGMLTVKDGGDPLNPADWTKSATPVFSQSTGAYGPGHNGFFKSPDGKEDWIIYHARSVANSGNTAPRNIRIQKFTWDADGTPNFGTPVPINVSFPKPSGEY